MHLLVPRSRSSAKVKVKYKGYICLKMAVSGAFMFRTHLFFFYFRYALVMLESLAGTRHRIYRLRPRTGEKISVLHRDPWGMDNSSVPDAF